RPSSSSRQPLTDRAAARPVPARAVEVSGTGAIHGGAGGRDRGPPTPTAAANRAQVAEMWQLVHTSKWGSWALLVSLSFVLVAAVKSREGRNYGKPGASSSVTAG